MIASFRHLSSRVYQASLHQEDAQCSQCCSTRFYSADNYEQGSPTYSAVPLDRIVEELNRVAENNPVSAELS